MCLSCGVYDAPPCVCHACLFIRGSDFPRWLWCSRRSVYIPLGDVENIGCPLYCRDPFAYSDSCGIFFVHELPVIGGSPVSGQDASALPEAARAATPG